MQSLIITDNPRQAAFIQKGFQYEQLPCEVLSCDELARLQEEIPFCDGIFLLLTEISKVRQYSLFCQKIKPDLPLIVLAQNDCPELQLLRCEIDITIAIRPFSFRTIAAEMRIAIFRMREKIEENRFAVRDLELDIFSHRVRCEGKELRLRNKEFGLLHYFMLNEGKVLSRHEILENVWDRNANIMTNTVDVHVSQLRRKISDCTDDSYIHTVPCAGYFMA